jgi:membrane dipeptidase
MSTRQNITRREFARLTTAAVVAPLPLAAVPARVPARVNIPEPPDGWPGYANAIVIDALASPGPFNVPDRTGAPLTPEMLENVRASGITAVNVTANGGGAGHASFDATMRELGYWMRELAEQPDVLVQVRSVADLRVAKETGRLGLILGFQDAAMLEGDTARLDLFHDFGVRAIQLTYNLRNELGDGCLEPGNAGLSRFGQAAVERMNALGILVDLSHCGQRTTADAIRISAAPVAITHSGCDAVFAHPRNKRDDELRALAERGGVIGIYMMPFLNASGPAGIDDFMRHVEHAIQVCGEDHVGVGSDNSITPTVADEAYRRSLAEFAVLRQSRGIAAPRENEVLFVEGLNTPRRMETIADVMLTRGHGEARVAKILGGNWLRLFEATWR